MKIRPEMTGDTEKGRSIRVMRAFLPRNRNLVIAHAAQTPKMVLRGTAISAVVSVRRSAARASGSRSAAA